MAEKQLDHRLGLETKALDAEIQRAARGQIFALALSLVVIGVCALIIMTGHPLIGLAGILLNLAGLAGVFVYATRERGQQLTKRAQLPAGSQGLGGTGS
jgi:CHASE2 domain-containing sensor protein